MERWSIYVDMEGFSALYAQEDQILWSLGQMMLAVYRIGSRAYPSEPDRLFVHQTGDGFVIQSDFPEESPVRAISIAVVILRHVARTGRYARAALSEGEMADIVGCYPSEVRESQIDHGLVPLGAGLMTLFPVMGMGLIRSVGVNNSGPRGPLLLLDPRFRTRLPPNMPTKPTNENGESPLSIDWVHIELPLADQIAAQAHLPVTSTAQIEQGLRNYCQMYKKPEWVSSVVQYLHVKP
jgi:hypothetical protein